MALGVLFGLWAVQLNESAKAIRQAEAALGISVPVGILISKSDSNARYHLMISLHDINFVLSRDAI
jgi:hypothetical protein